MFRRIKDNLLAHGGVRPFCKSPNKRKVAVVLSGCGVFDGSEIHEASATAVHLCRKNLQPIFYSPNIGQTDVVNHSTGEKIDQPRNVFTESARIARGDLKQLSELTVCDADAIIFPGGFGVAKNLSNYATASVSCALNIDVCRVIQDFHAQRKPMGFMCISSILAARMIPNVVITLGARGTEPGQSPEDWPHSDALDAAVQMGASIELQGVHGISIDVENMVVSTPAFMYRGDFYQVFTGIGRLVDQMECLLRMGENNS
ncbi:UNVERIFIED_CONTAM: hypothetical protein PYX00_007771 [Menopon gallinae]|uniref:Uncharacterized protein n=1 Tax=Menopon gallinae TaxID=328185 RepID=A0AAW2HKI4_9NEOP